MSSICGIYKRNGATVEKEEINQMIRHLNYWDADYSDSLTYQHIGFGHLMLYNTPESHTEKLPYHNQESGLFIAADARIDNREELMKKIDMKGAANLSDSQLILESFKIYNKRCVDHLVGAFAFTIWDEKKKELFCVRDHIGFKPFHYYIDTNKFLFGTEMKNILHYPGVDTTINEQFIADALATLKSENTKTFYKHIHKLPPAHYMVVNRDTSYMKRYWDLDPNVELQLESEEEYIQQFREKLNEAVRCRLRSSYDIGTELSGGIDSSAVTGFASQFTTLKTFSHTLPDWALNKQFPYEDERKFIQKVTSHCQINDSYFITGEEEGILKSLKTGVKLHDGLIQGSLSLFSDAVYQKALETKTRTLLSGFGGDELVSYQGGGRYKELAYKHQYGKLINEFKHQTNTPALKGVKNIVGSIIAAYLYRIKKMFGMQPEYKTPSWAHDIFHELFLERGFFREQNMKEHFYQKKRLPNDPDIRMRQYRRFHYSYFPMRLENCYIAAQAKKVEYRYPLLDKRLLEFYLSLPSEMKVKNGWGRYILRKSMEGILPADIQWRDDKVGTTIPGVNIRFNKDLDAIKSLIQKASENSMKHYVDYDKMLAMLEKIAHRSKTSKGRIIPQAFFSAVSLLLYYLEEY